jgi:antitoxin (DNA-binding transcriptional repressor) of toxin-antitoxin stability system
MTHQINLQEAQTKLPELLQTAIDGEEVIILQGKQPLVHLVPHKKKFMRRIGTAQGEVNIKEGFKSIPEDFKEYML